jgi:integrase
MGTGHPGLALPPVSLPISSCLANPHNNWVSSHACLYLSATVCQHHLVGHGQDYGQMWQAHSGGRKIKVAKKVETLSAVRVRNLRGPGYFSDGGNLYFRIAPGGATGWIFRYAVAGKTRDMGLGGFPQISLASARKHAAECRELLQRGIDPIEQRRAQRGAQRVAETKSKTFDDCAREYIADHEAGWSNAKHRQQWVHSLAAHVSPVFGKLPVSAIDDGLVLRVLKAIWHTRPETASRVRGRIESVLDWARVHGYRNGENPARWKGHLDHLLPARAKLARIKHHPALPYTEIGTFMATLRERDDLPSLALQFAILTAARTGEVVGARWDEIDLKNKTWTIPGERMKGGKEHRVPLSTAAITILEQLRDRDDEFVFANRPGRPLSVTALLDLMRRMGRHNITVHGFRSTFRDWGGERTNFANHVVEMALAHAVPSAVEAAYRRGDLFEKRRRLMDAWAQFCASAGSGDVVPMRKVQ